MTGPCSGAGVGTPKAGFAALQYIGPGAIGGALAGLSGWEGAAVGASIGALTFDLVTFCPNGPPAMPTFTAADIVALLSPIPTAARASAALKFQDFLGNIFWPLLCDCSSGTSTLGAPSTYPAGAPANDTTAPASGTCRTYTYSHAFLAGGAGATDTTASLLGVGATLLVLTATATPHTAAQSSTFTVSFTQNGSVTNQPGSPVVTNAAQGPLVRYFALPANLEAINIQYTPAGNAGTTYTMTAQLDIYCGNSSPNAPASGCCPPDPATQAMLDQLLAMVTLIQRQAAPFSYVYGTNHTGLTGHGSFSVADLLGVSVDVTTLPSSYGTAVGSPEQLFDLGYINLGTADGWTSSRRVDHDGTLFIPNAGGLYTAVGYSLSSGVEVAIRELVREP